MDFRSRPLGKSVTETHNDCFGDRVGEITYDSTISRSGITQLAGKQHAEVAAMLGNSQSKDRHKHGFEDEVELTIRILLHVGEP